MGTLDAGSLWHWHKTARNSSEQSSTSRWTSLVFEEHLEYNLDNYLKFFDGDVGDEIFLEMYREVDVVVDQPACTLWSVLYQQFPDAKIILMERDSAEDWFRSYFGMLESYRRNQLSRFFRLYSWLSKTHYKLGG